MGKQDGVKLAAKYAEGKLKHGTRVRAQPKDQITLSQPKWDQGATGQANRAGLIQEPRGHFDEATGKTINPNNIKGVRRVDMLEIYHKRGWITKRGYNAGAAYRDAWEATEKAPGMNLSQDRVDSTAKPDAAIDIRIDRMSHLVGLSSKVPSEDKGILFTVACEGNSISKLRQYRGMRHENGKVHLYEALERLADRMEGR